jgi:hypothetical protein
MSKQFTLRIEMNNAAFDDGEGGMCELYNILRSIAKGIGSHNMGGNIISGDPGQWGVVKDSNGNPVGQWHFKRTRRS